MLAMGNYEVNYSITSERLGAKYPSIIDKDYYVTHPLFQLLKMNTGKNTNNACMDLEYCSYKGYN
jgi:hypothetical protein